MAMADGAGGGLGRAGDGRIAPQEQGAPRRDRARRRHLARAMVADLVLPELLSRKDAGCFDRPSARRKA